jgi:putative zinc finger/helix-turn-helix YgiT family protein
VPATQLIRGEEVRYNAPKFVCSACEAAFMSPAQATEGVRLAVAAYQRKHGLLTADEIRQGRRHLDIDTAELAVRAHIGEATVKRLEAGTTVQQASTNRLLVDVFKVPAELADYSVFFDLNGAGEPCAAESDPWEDGNQWNNPDSWLEAENAKYANSAEPLLAA